MGKVGEQGTDGEVVRWQFLTDKPSNGDSAVSNPRKIPWQITKITSAAETAMKIHKSGEKQNGGKSQSSKSGTGTTRAGEEKTSKSQQR